MEKKRYINISLFINHHIALKYKPQLNHNLRKLTYFMACTRKEDTLNSAIEAFYLRPLQQR